MSWSETFLSRPLAGGQKRSHRMKPRGTDEDLVPCSAGLQMRASIGVQTGPHAGLCLGCWGRSVSRNKTEPWKGGELVCWLTSCKSWTCVPHEGHVPSAICALGQFGHDQEVEARGAVGNHTGENKARRRPLTAWARWGSGDTWGGVAGGLACSFSTLPHKADITDFGFQVALTQAAWLGTCYQQGPKQRSRHPGGM